MRRDGGTDLSSYKISIIIPVLHEAERINAALSRLAKLKSSVPFEIIVVDGAEGRDTLTAVRTEGVVKISSGRGRGRQMNAGAARARGDILLFLHADTVLPSEGLRRIFEAMSHDHYAAGAFDLGIRTDRNIFKITEKYVALRTRLTRIPFGDQAIFMRRAYFEKLGGYRDIPVMEDVDLMKRVKARKDMICIIPEKVLTSPRRWEREGVLYCTLRNWALQILYTFGVPPERLAKFYQRP